MPAEIGIKIGADISEVVALGATVNKILSTDIPAATKKSNAALADFSSELDTSTLSLQDCGKQLSILSTALSRTNNPTLIKGYETAIAKLEDRILELKTQGTRSITEVNSSINTLQKNVAAFGGGVKTFVPSDYFKPLKSGTADIKELAAASTTGFASIASGANSAFGIVRKIAFILPGIGIAGIFGLIGDGLVNLLTKTKEVDKATQDYQKSLDSISGKTAEETSRVEVLVQALQSGKLSREQTKGAIEELKKIAPDYFGLLDKEKASVQQITAAYSSYNNALVAVIENQIKQADLTEKIKKRLELQTQFKEADAFVKNFISSGKTLDDLVKTIASENVSADIKRATTATDGLKIAQSVAVQQAIKGDQEAKKSTTDRVKGLNELVTALLVEQNVLKTISPTDIKIPEISLKNVKVKDTDKFIVPAQVSFEGTLRDNLQKELDKGLDVTKAFKKNGGFDKTGDALLSDQILRANEQLDGIREKGVKVGEVLTGTLKPAFDDLFNSIVTGSGNALQALGQALTQIIQKLIVAALEAALFAAIISLATGGFGATAKGGGFSANFGKLFGGFSGLPKFADGGVASGPKSGFLAVLHGNELVVPLDKATKKLPSMLSSDTSGSDLVEFRIKGDDLVALNNKTNKRKSRLG